MVGRYPYVDPNRFRTREQGERVLRQILEAGITHFVSLQAELPPQQDMRMAGLTGFLPYHATASLLAASMSGLPPEQEMTGLRNEQLNQFLPPKRSRKSAEGQQQSSQKPRIKLHFSHVPIIDLSIPTYDQVQGLVGDVDAWLSAGEGVYLHCWGGRGRAGTMAACVLISLYGLSSQQALKHIQAAYDTRAGGGYSPETSEQQRFVRAWEARQAG